MSRPSLKCIKLSFAVAMLLPLSSAMAESTAPEATPAPQSAKPGPITIDTISVYRQKPEVQDYTYGMKMDIAKVVSLEYFPPTPNFCGVIPAQMTYEDSNGHMHAIRYLYPETKGCGNN